MSSDASEQGAALGWPFPAAVTISAPSWQSELTQQGQVLLIRPRVVIGNDPDCDIALLDSGIAHHHAAISWTTDGYQIEDLGSVTGTWVEGKRLFKVTPLALGASIRIGGATLLFTTPRGEQTTVAPAATPTHLATPSASGAAPLQSPAMQLGDPVRVAAALPQHADHADHIEAIETEAIETEAIETEAIEEPLADPQQTPIPAPRPATVPIRTSPPLQATSPAQPPLATPAPAAAHPSDLAAMPPAPGYVPSPPAFQPMPPAQPNGFVQQTPMQQPMQPVPAPGGVVAAGERFDLNAWLAEQQPRFYWKFFLIGLAVLIGAEVTASSTSNFIPVMMIILLYSGLAPITFVIFLWEQGAEAAEFSPIVLVAAFGCGGTVGLILGSTLDGVFNANANALIPALLIGVAEETGKVAALYYFMRDPKLRKEIQGLLLGAAAGMGFAALETSGYGFVAFVQGLVQGGTFSTALNAANQQLFARMLLAIFGHGVWTAIVCSAIWRERGNQVFAATRGVVIAFSIAVGLHGLWDFSIGQGWLPITIGTGTYPGFDILIVGPLGLLILSFFLREAMQQALLGPAAPPPPLDEALRAYFNAIFSRFGGSRPTSPAQPYGLLGAPYPQQGPQPGPQAGPFPTPYRQQPAPPQQMQPSPPQPQYPAPVPQPIARQAQVLPPAQAAPPQWPLAPQWQQQPPQQQQPIWPLPSQPQPHPLATVPYCAHCGITYPPGATICTNCGSPLTEAMAR